MRNQHKGYIERCYRVTCRCRTQQVSFALLKRAAEGEFRALGWRNTKQRGWMCPDCQEEIEAVEKRRGEG